MRARQSVRGHRGPPLSRQFARTGVSRSAVPATVPVTNPSTLGATPCGRTPCRTRPPTAPRVRDDFSSRPPTVQPNPRLYSFRNAGDALDNVPEGAVRLVPRRSVSRAQRRCALANRGHAELRLCAATVPLDRGHRGVHRPPPDSGERGLPHVCRRDSRLQGAGSAPNWRKFSRHSVDPNGGPIGYHSDIATVVYAGFERGGSPRAV